MNEEKVRYVSYPINKDIFKVLSMPVIEINLYGKSHLFLLDTGCNDIIICEKAAKSLKVKVQTDSEDTYSVSGIIDKQTDIVRGKIHIKVGNVDAEIECNVVDISPVNTIISKSKELKKLKLSGILGSAFFFDYSWVLDFHRLVVGYPEIFTE